MAQHARHERGHNTGSYGNCVGLHACHRIIYDNTRKNTHDWSAEVSGCNKRLHQTNLHILALIQKYFHIIKLNPEAYYMPYVPIEINALSLIVLNVAVIIISYITLLAPSYIISTIKPSSTIRFE